MMNRIKKRHIVALSLLAALTVLTIFYIRNDQNKNGVVIRPYDQDKDFQAIVNLVNANKYWVSERADFSAERMLLTKTPTNEPDRKGIVMIEVAEVEGQTAGFISYYRKSPEHGYIWVLAVDKNFRGRHLGESLVTHVITYFKSVGANYVTLNTRTNNKPALSLYKKIGFLEQSRDDDRGMVMLIKRNL